MRMTVEQVAGILETTVLVVRYGIQNQTLPGSYVKGPGKQKGSYIISSSQMAEHLKMPEKDLIQKVERMKANAKTRQLCKTTILFTSIE